MLGLFGGPNRWLCRAGHRLRREFLHAGARVAHCAAAAASSLHAAAPSPLSKALTKAVVLIIGLGPFSFGGYSHSQSDPIFICRLSNVLTVGFLAFLHCTR
jgi:hypothetical protein